MARTVSPFQFRTIKNTNGDDYQRGVFHPERSHDVADALNAKFGDSGEIIAHVMGKGAGCRVVAIVHRDGDVLVQGAECGGKNRDAATLAAFEALASMDAPENENTPEGEADAPKTDDKPKKGKGKKNKGKKSEKPLNVEAVKAATVEHYITDGVPEDVTDLSHLEPSTPETGTEDTPENDTDPIGFGVFARIVRGLWTQSATVFAGGSASGDVDVAAHEIADLMDETERVAQMCDAAEAADVAECVVNLMANQRAILLGIDAGRIDGQRSRKLRKFVKRATDGATA